MASLLKGIRFLAACIMRQRGADHEKGFFYRLLQSRRRNKKDSEGLVQNKIRDRKCSVPRFKFDLLYYKI
uniref:Putative ovule protein n=1 Tax=Solanum chacoense TaxID=4108 RepID=A0A0V0HEV4_SOLCH